jgi:hypothetical protein
MLNATATPPPAQAAKTVAPEAPVSPGKPHFSSKHFEEIEAKLRAGTLEERLIDHIANTEKMLRITEDLMLSMVMRQKMQRSFFRSWKADANSLHRIAILAHHRMQRHRAGANQELTPRPEK